MEDKILMILEVSRKQDYIFGSKKLRENTARSADINFATSDRLFQIAAGEVYDTGRNFVYAGGGHSVLGFADRGQAREFATRVTEYVMRKYNGLEMFVAISEEQNGIPGERLKKLSEELEKKKSRRKDSFQRMRFGLESLVSTEEEDEALKKVRKNYENTMEAGRFLGENVGTWMFPTVFDELQCDLAKDRGIDDNFIAVIHVDGNAMGSRVSKIYDKYQTNFEEAARGLQRFSEGIQRDFETAFGEMVKTVIRMGHSSSVLPLRPVILAGDDVCFVTAGSIGLECARVFMEELAKLKNAEDGMQYASCAGVVMVHRKYPFHRAYEMAEELCSSAKKYGTVLNENGEVSAIDWHIEFGQLKDSLADIRRDYVAEDGCRMELRPYVVLAPGEKKPDACREYEFFREMCGLLQENREQFARGKMKEWRDALRQGGLESRLYLHRRESSDILYHAFAAMYRSRNERMKQYERILMEGQSIKKEAFLESAGEKHCLFFDAIEAMDHIVLFEEAQDA